MNTLTETEKAIAHLKEKGYLVIAKGVPVLTSAFFQYLNVKEVVSGTKVDTKQLYKDFIGDRNVVPFRLSLGLGRGEYTVAAYSLDGQKAFERVLKDPKVSISKLRYATQQYYKDHRNARPTMTNYFLKGIWEQAYSMYSGELDTSDKKDEDSFEEPSNTLLL